MISDSSLYSAEQLVATINKLLTDNDMSHVPENHYGRTVNAFPFLQLLASLNDRINKLENKDV